MEHIEQRKSRLSVIDILQVKLETFATHMGWMHLGGLKLAVMTLPFAAKASQSTPDLRTTQANPSVNTRGMVSRRGVRYHDVQNAVAK